MANVFDIALVFSPHEWVEALHRHCTNTGTLRIRALIYDSVVLEAESFDACVISDSHPALSSGLVKSLHDTHKIVIGVCDDSTSAREFLAEIGVDGIFSSRISAEELSSQIQLFLEKTTPDSFNEPSALSNLNNDCLADISKNDSESSNTKTISVIGAGGSGSTELALVLTSRLIDSIVIDVDFEHPSLAPRAGLSIEPNMIGAIESAANDLDSFAKQTQRMRSNAAIVGTSHASFARDIRNYELEALSKALTLNYSNIIFDHGRITEDSTFFESHRFLLERSDVVLIVGESTPVGVLRILENVALLNSIMLELDRSFEICVVVNKCTKNQQATADVCNEISNIEQVSKVTTLPYASDCFRNSWQSTIGQPKSWKKSIDQLLNWLSDLDNNKVNIIDFSVKTKNEMAKKVQVSV